MIPDDVLMATLRKMTAQQRRDWVEDAWFSEEWLQLAVRTIRAKKAARAARIRETVLALSSILLFLAVSALFAFAVMAA